MDSRMLNTSNLKKVKIKFLIKGLLSAVFFSAILFICAGRTDYMQGWVYFITTLVTMIMNFCFIRNDAGLMAERSEPGQGTKSWDRLILGLSALVFIGIMVVAGLDSGRFRWSVPFHWSLIASGLALTIAGQLFFLLARRENAFFSTVMRIQKEKGHTVCKTGLYRYVRHPGYLGMSLSLGAIPLITASLWSIIPVAVEIILLMIRTNLEDEALKHELDGYVQYAKETRYRLIPYVW